ncbi:MAG: helix-turn-helix domain-containing protein [Pyrinomonadaceae bacterium]
MINIYNIPEFLKYLNVEGCKSNSINVIKYDDHKNLRLKSDPVSFDFYMLAIKSNLEGDVDYGQTDYDESNSFLFLDGPKSELKWNFNKSFSGYNFMIDARLYDKFALGNNSPDYDSHEVLFLTEDEEILLEDIFEKAYTEYLKDKFSTDILASYARLILSYANTFYERQFDTRKKLYNEIVTGFFKNLESYYFEQEEFIELPSVSYFAEKSNHSPNYFGDVIKHFTASSPLEVIHQHIIKIAKEKLRNRRLTVSQIGYSLGFEYPTYFTRFFKKKTGMTPTEFRNQ